MSKSPLNIAIVGGGIGGLTLTTALLHQGITPHIYEAAPAFTEIGAGLMNGPNTVYAMNLISPALLDAFKKCVTFNKDPAKADTFLTLLYGTDSKNGDGKRAGDLIEQLEPIESVKEGMRTTGTRAMSTVHRAKFLDSLIASLPPGIVTFNKAVSHVESQGLSEGVKIHFTDGSVAIADAVIGCDGIKSRVRASMFPNPPEAQYTGEYAYRSLIPVHLATKILGEDIATNGHLWCGYNGYLINYPVEHGSLVNIVAVVRNPQLKEWKEETLVASVSREEMYAEFEDWDPRIQALLREFKTSDRWALWDLPHSQPYYSGKVCLLGDAAHASTPHLGAGAGFAVEDSYLLSGLLALAPSREDLEKVFEAYDAVRRPRSQNLVRKSRAAFEGYAMLGEGIGDDADALRRDAQEKFRWIWEIDLDAHLEDARKSLRESLGE